ncbi:CYP enzymes assisting alcohol dehydrogenase-like [Magnolia sinica]|uniref:CYP enzymes assisting alcohol dehydrogenase-like n=1 Tax=Magnolia sinica TaxID=86752 RepID=UPI00265B5EA1|nr:CYP enzymes assisting alcohol dehydrogenase-like [Magnolia sinica]
MNSSKNGSPALSKRVLQAITCKAAVCWGIEQPLKIEEIQVDAPGPSEVRVKMLSASLCHTDILYWKGFHIPTFPRVLGHEGVGVVESVGEGVTEFKEGEMVIPTYIGECKECNNCRSEMTNLCEKYPFTLDGRMPDGTTRMSVKGQRLYHLISCSTWSEYTVMNVNYVVKIDPRVPLPHASLISCGFSTGFGGAWREARVRKGSSVAVFGLGGVGLGAVQGARMCGATKIIGVDLNERKREKGLAFGMTDFINPKKIEKSVSEAIREMTDGAGVDYSFECTGVPPLINEALDSTKMGRGVVIVIGASTELTLPVNFLSLLSGRTLKGSIYGGIRPHSDLPHVIHKCINKEIQLDKLVTHEVRLDDINRAFELTEQPDCLKVIIKMTDTE